MRRVLASVALVAATLTAAPVLASAQEAPSITLSLQAATVGQPVTVAGRGFPPTSPISVQLCGNQAARGSIDCDVVAGQTVVADETGSFQSQVVVRFPPVPCPCVVWATSNGASAADAMAAIAVVSAPVAAPGSAAPPTQSGAAAGLQIVRASMHQRDRWRSWLGFSSTADLTVVVRNPGTAVIDRPVFTLTLGKGSDPSGIVAVPQLDSLQPGEQRSIVVPVHIGAVSFGTYTVKGTIAGVVFRAHVSVFPFVPLVVVLVVVAVAVWRRRRRAAPAARAGTEEAVAEVAGTREAEPVLVERPDPESAVPEVETAVPEVEVEVEVEIEIAAVDAAQREPEVDVEPEPAPEVEPVAVAAMSEPAAEPVPPVAEPAAGSVEPAEPEEPALPPARKVRVVFTWPVWMRTHSVSVCGEFNDWSTEAHPLTRQDSGVWEAEVDLEAGRSYRYKFFVDGERWENDWLADGVVPNDFGTEDSVVVVGDEDRYANLAEQQIPRPDGIGHSGEVEDDDVVDLTALDELAPPSDDFWAEEPEGLRVKLRRWRR